MSDLKIEFDVRGSKPIKFEEGWLTGGMTETGICIATVWYQDGRSYGGCIDREEAKQLRDFLNACIDKWDGEQK